MTIWQTISGAAAAVHHPDRLIGHGVPAEFITIAGRTLAAINVAFESLARERDL